MCACTMYGAAVNVSDEGNSYKNGRVNTNTRRRDVPSNDGFIDNKSAVVPVRPL